MNLLDVPFGSHVGIERKNENHLSLDFTKRVQNHIGTLHASAQFTLAETQSAYYLESVLPQYKGKVLPLLRSSSVKYKNPAIQDIYARAFIEDKFLEKFKKQFLKKGRASIKVEVEVLDINGSITMMGEFIWFMQQLEE